MLKLYVYNRVPLCGPHRRNKPAKEYPVNSRMILVDFDGDACLVKPAGKGNHTPMSVRACFIECLVPFSAIGPYDFYYDDGQPYHVRVPMNSISTVQFIKALEVKIK